jgi:hypothetical protein
LTQALALTQLTQLHQQVAVVAAVEGLVHGRLIAQPRSSMQVSRKRIAVAERGHGRHFAPVEAARGNIRVTAEVVACRLDS